MKHLLHIFCEWVEQVTGIEAWKVLVGIFLIIIGIGVYEWLQEKMGK